MNRVIIFLSILLLLCIITSCADKAEKAKDNEPIKIGVLVWPGYAHSYIAQEKGYKVLAYSSGILPAVIVDVLAFNSEIVRERPDDVKSIIKSLLAVLSNFIKEL